MKRWVTVLVWLVAMLPACARGPLRAVVVGNCDYSPWPRLKGPAQDVRIMQALLASLHPDAHVDVLRDADGPAMEQAYRHLAESARPGDTVVFYYAGHGGTVPDPSGRHPGGETCLVGVGAPIPWEQAGEYPGHVVRASAINEIIHTARDHVQPGGSAVFIFDSCCSGGMTRDVRPVRTLPGMRSPAGDIPMPLDLPGDGWVFLSACRADQSAQDDDDFTHHLDQAVRSLPRQGATYRDLMDVLGSLGPSVDISTPQSEGDVNLELLGGRSLPFVPGIHILEVYPSGPDTRIELDKGTLLGVTPGSKLAVYPPHTRSPQGTHPTAVATVMPQTTSLRGYALVPGHPAGLQHGVAWVTEQSAPLRLLHIGCDDGALLHSIETVLKGQVTMAAPPDLVLKTDGNEVHIGGQTVPRDQVIAVLKRELMRLSFVYTVTDSPDNPAVGLTLTPGTATDRSIQSFVPTPSDPHSAIQVVRAGTVALLRVTNHAETPLYATVVYLQADGTSVVVFPSPGADASWTPLPPGQTQPVLLRFGLESGQGYAVEGLKVILTQAKIDIPYLNSRQVSNDPVTNFVSQFLSGSRNIEVRIHPDKVVLSRPLWIRIEP